MAAKKIAQGVEGEKMIRVREYHPADLEYLPELIADLSGKPTTLADVKKRMQLIDSNPYYATFVATLKDKIVGMIGARLTITYTSNELKTQISSMVTKKEYEGKGVGRALINRVEGWAQENGSPFIYLLSGFSKERERAHQFYKTIGFEVTGYRFVKRLAKTR